MEEEEALSIDESQAMQEVLTSLIQEYQNTLSRSQKITILTIFGSTWSRRRIMNKFGCSQRMATQAKRLVIEKGILSIPNPKVGRGLEPDIVESVKKIFYKDNISRVMPGKKDCVTNLQNGEKMRIQETFTGQPERSLPAV